MTVGAKVSGDPLLRNPITGIAACWARDANGHAATEPTTSFMNSRRFMCPPPMLKAQRINPRTQEGVKRNAGYVRFGSKADICSANRHVRFTLKSGHAPI